MIKVEKICKKYISKGREVVALEDVSLNFGNKGMVFILGKSGCGKTTLLNMLGGLDDVDSGNVSIELDATKKNITSLSEDEMDILRNIHIGFIFQEYNLIDNWNVGDNITIALRQQSVEHLNQSDIDNRLSEILKYVELAGMEGRKPTELSGGQAQRVAIARALIKEPSVILADEPTGNLDSKSGAKVFELLKGISQNCLVIVVSHDEKSAFQYGDRIIRLSDGKVVDDINNLSTGEKYEVTIENCISGKKETIVTRSLEKAKEYLANMLVQKNKQSAQYIVGVTSNTDNEIIEDDIRPKREAKVKNIDRKTIFKLALNNLKKRKLRLGITVSIFAIAMFFLQILLQLSLMDIGKPVSEYLLNNQESLYLKSAFTYENDFFETYTVERSDTENIQNVIKKYWNIKDVNESLANVEIVSNDGNEIVVLLSTASPQGKLLSGSGVQSDNDIVITDFCSAMLGLGSEAVGQKIEMFGAWFNICGIIDTDYEERDMIKKISKNNATEQEMYDIEYKYLKVICSDNITDYLKSNACSIELEASDFTALSDSRYFSSALVYGNAEDIGSEDILIYGRYPEKENEMVISYEYAQMNALLDEDNLNLYMDCAFKDIYDNRYNGAYEGRINMYDMFETVEIVGVVETYEHTSVDVWLYSEDYQKVSDVYCDKFFQLYELSLQNKSIEELREELNEIYNMGIYVEEPVVRQIQGIYEQRDELIVYGILLAVIFVLLTLLLNVSFMSYSVSDNQRKVGILRALGINKKTVSKIFAYESVIVSVVAYILSIIGSTFTFAAINNYYANVEKIDARLFYQSIPIIQVVFVFSILLGILSVILPVISMSKQKPVKLIKGN